MEHFALQRAPVDAKATEIERLREQIAGLEQQVAGIEQQAAGLAEALVTPQELLARHQTGDFGNLCAEDREANRRALRLGCRVLSQYDLSTGEKVWIIAQG